MSTTTLDGDGPLTVEEMQRERAAQVRFAYRDGWSTGFFIGLMVGGGITVVALMVTWLLFLP